MRRCGFYLFLFFSLIPLHSQGADSSLGEVQVIAQDESKDESGEGGPVSEAAHDTAAFTTVIPAKKFEGRRTNLSEVLEEAGGVRIRRYGGLDDFATLSIRGSTTEQVAVYLDGILLNQGIGGAVNIAAIPTDQIERIEIYKGVAPAWFGSSSIGGVVNIVTRSAGASRETHFTQSYGSFETYEGTLSQSERRSQTTYEMGYTYNRSAGDFTFLNDNGTPFNTADDREVARANNEFSRHNLLTKIGHRFSRDEGPLENLTVRFHNQFFREDRGIPGLATLTSDVADLSTTRNGVSIEIARKAILPKLDLVLTPFFQYQKLQLSDPNGEIGLGAAQQTDDDAFQYGSAFRLHLLAGTRQRWSLQTEYRGEQFLPEDLTGGTVSPSSVRNSLSLGLEDEIFLWSERVVLNPSVRSEHIFNEAAGTASALHPFSGKIGIKYRPFGSGEKAVLKSNFSRSYRLPSFSELFGDRGSINGNADLRPEKGLNWDAGASLDFQELAALSFPVRLEVSYYLNHIDDLIQFLQTSQFTVQPRNLSRARLQGIETHLSLSPLSFLDLAAGYTFQWAKDISGLPGIDGKFLPGRPRHEAGARATLRHRRGKIYSDLDFIDDNFLDTQNILKVNSRFLLNTGASVTFLKKFTANFEVKNLLNNPVSDVVGFPLPGRSYYGKLEIKI